MRHFSFRTYVALVAILGLSACNSSDSGDTPTAPPASFATVSIVAENGSQSFAPNPAVSDGQRVAWRNDDDVTHRIVANDGTFDTGDIIPGSTSMSIRPPNGGTNYHCSIHPTTMFGAIAGTSGQAPPCSGQYCDDPCCD